MAIGHFFSWVSESICSPEAQPQVGSCCPWSLPCWGPSPHPGDKKQGELTEEGRGPRQIQQRAGAGGVLAKHMAFSGHACNPHPHSPQMSFAVLHMRGHSHLLSRPHCAKCSTCVFSFNPCSHPMRWVLLLSPFYRWGEFKEVM